MALPDGGPGTASSRGSSEDASSPAEEEEEEEDEEEYMKRHALRQAEMNNELLVRQGKGGGCRMGVLICEIYRVIKKSVTILIKCHFHNH